MSIENIHLWHSDRGTYFDRNVNIISWSDRTSMLENTVQLGEIVTFFFTQIIGPIG